MSAISHDCDECGTPVPAERRGWDNECPNPHCSSRLRTDGGTEQTDTDHVNQNKLTVRIPDFECTHCIRDSRGRASYEDGEWVHYICGMPVPDEVAEEADERLANGEGVHKYPEEEVKQIADPIAEGLERADRIEEDTDGERGGSDE